MPTISTTKGHCLFHPSDCLTKPDHLNVDRCKDHGVWLDGGELRHLFEWMKAGGKLLHQEWQER